MAKIAISEYLKLIPELKLTTQKYLWSSYDFESDALYINFKKASRTTKSKLQDNNILIRYDGASIAGVVVFNVSKR